MSDRLVGRLVVAVLMMCATCCGETSYLYRLGSESYSPTAKAFLFSVTVDNRELLQSGRLESPISWLAIYDHEAKRVTRVGYPTDVAFFDWAWVPGQEAFVVAGTDRMILYRKGSDGRFDGTAIPCPADTLYIRCSWSPAGRWLAVMCNDVRIGKGGFKLGMYDLNKNKYVGTNIPMKPRPPVWKDDSIVCITADRAGLTPDGGVFEMHVNTPIQVPVLGRPIVLEKGVSQFYGMIDDQPLTRKGKKIQLGNRVLAELDLASDRRVATTETTIFISASSTNLVAFDRYGRQVGKTNPGRIIQLGPSGEDSDVVYGLTGSVLQYVCRTDASVDVETICDLAEFTY